jgi:HAMP domain-containing protein
VSYLLVVGMVLLPTVVYLRTSLTRDARNQTRQELEVELTAICHRLSDATPEQLVAHTAILGAALRTRLTVVDTNGNVLGDSIRTSTPPENHANRPEIRAALSGQIGESMRVSRTTGQSMFYVAMRFPKEGAPRGVARLARAESAVYATRNRVTEVLRSASAVALSAAVLLSLVAALAASRPLKRIAQHARALADGDFGTHLEVTTRDEIGEVAEALGALASQLRSRLVTSGVDRATLQALLDDIPVGVILYDSQRKPTAINGAARVMCNLEPFAELERATELARASAQQVAIERVMTDGFTVQTAMMVPWKTEAKLVARWVAVFGVDGGRLPALILLDGRDAAQIVALRNTVETLAIAARQCLDSKAIGARVALAREILTATTSLQQPDPDPHRTQVLTVQELLSHAISDVSPIADAMDTKIEVSVADPEVSVIDTGERIRSALSLMMLWALDDPQATKTVVISTIVQQRLVRFGMRASRSASENGLDVTRFVGPLGGDSGMSSNEDGCEAWLEAPRA